MGVGGEEFGPWLARQLSRMDISQAELAERVGLTRAAVSAWVNGRSEPRDDTKRLIADAFGTDEASLAARVTDVVTTLPLRWHHRRAHADGGREYGNAAAFAFDADMAVLTREATQNSLDERLDTGAPVRVEYTLHELTGSRLKKFLDALQWDELLPHYEQAAGAPQKVSRSLRAALDDLAAGDSLLLLRVDDYNATGLTGPEYADGRFAAVVRRQLDSHKTSASRAGGSYGLGKATLWATSRFGLVLVNSTLSEAHEGRTDRRVIGRLDLPWHEVGGDAYAGPAWFGEPDTAPDHRNVARSWWAAEDTVRDLHLERSSAAPGTSFLIVGAHDASGDAEDLRDIHDKLVRSLADGFWASMVGGRRAGPLLEATVRTLRDGRVIVPEERVDPSVRHPGLCRALRAYLDEETVDALTSENQVAAVEVPIVVTPRKGQVGGKGNRHGAVLLLTPTADGDEKHSRVVCMRGNRMTITEHRPRELPPGSIPFQAVLLAGYATERDGQDVALAEAFLRASEPPEHDRWDRTEELTSLYARGALTRLKEFRAEIDKAVRGLVQRETAPRAEGPAGLRELLRLDYSGPAQRRSASFPIVDRLDATLKPSGAWSVAVTVKLPDADDPWLLTPVAKFDVRSGGKPVVDWASLSATDNCRLERGNLVVDAGVRRAEFHGVTDPATHPVRGALARLVVEVQRARGGAA
ncbi:helix-turn-helix transcriptional regulator [Streptomyces sp. R33]|uniref:helix-turn-helix transcriptional regulator n=1 Tax=Streptomyces sp. R33 TaxID=3238629 RepID=UPI00351097F2